MGGQAEVHKAVLSAQIRYGGDHHLMTRSYRGKN